MSGPLDFAARLLARRGAIVEPGAEALEALLSPDLAAELGLGEHVVLAETPGSTAHHVGYGSALLERMVMSAASAIPFVSARAVVAPARRGQARAAAEALVFRNGIFTVSEPMPTVGQRLVVHAAFALHGDERREGLCAAAASLLDRGVVAGFDEAVRGVVEEATARPVEPSQLVASAHAALSACVAHASRAAELFREGIERRFTRDRERLEGYFDDLMSELDRRVNRGRVTRADAADKRRALESERAAKLEALSARYATRLEVRPIALLLVEVPVCRMTLELRRRKASRNIELEYDCATRRLVPPSCDACGSPASRPAACDGVLHLLCESCAPRSEGRVACEACRAKRDRPPHPQLEAAPISA